MLHQLDRYATQAGLVTEPGFATKTVRWGIPCDASGAPTGQLIDLTLGNKKSKGRTFKAVPHLTLPEMKRGGSGTRHFLVDALEVVLGLGAEDDPKVAAKHAYFAGQLRDAGACVPELAILAEHLADPGRIQALRDDATQQKAKPTEMATFALDGQYVVTSDAWHDWWRAFRATLDPGHASGPSADARMISFMTGQPTVPARTHNKIKGLASVGGQPSGDVLASFKQDSFRSYGLVQSKNAAMSADDVVRYPAALSDLISRGKRFQHAIVAYWFDADSPLDPTEWVVGPERAEEILAILQEAKALLHAFEEGSPHAAKELDGHYYAYTLSGAAGRVMVRDVLHGPFAELVKHVIAWFNDLAIVARDGQGNARPPKFYAVLAATVRDLKDVPAPLEAALWRAALTGGAIPHHALALALERARMAMVADEAPRHARFGLLKAALNRTFCSLPEDVRIEKRYAIVSNALNEDHASPAYQSGRLMAVLANLQYSALGDVGAGVIQRYYASASASPALVLGRLLRNSQFHLNKLDPGLRVWYGKKIGSILDHVKGQFPGNLDLYQQSLFALGYYHQQAFDRTKKPKVENASNNESGTAIATEENN